MLRPPLFHTVVTTIQAPTPAIRKLGAALRREQGHLLIVGDRKGPVDFPQPGAELLTLQQQGKLPFRLASLLPVDHYTRKNLGYLVAISRTAACIYETDDDNCPSPGWRRRELVARAQVVNQPSWCNVFRLFTHKLIWPRGLPLDQIGSYPRSSRTKRATQRVFSPIQQGLVNGSPDVDAIWRLVLDQPFHFSTGISRALAARVWCPFNSQNTWWWPPSYPLMYLPSGCTFRMTDIWRSLVAQRCLWEMDAHLTFHAPDAIQNRNPHRLMSDFADEVPGYLANERIRQVLEAVRLGHGPQSAGPNLLRCYQALVAARILPRAELRLVRAWLDDLQQASQPPIT